MNLAQRIFILSLLLGFAACAPNPTDTQPESPSSDFIEIQAESFTQASSPDIQADGETVTLDSGAWIALELPVATAGRYRVNLHTSAANWDAVAWIEDYYDNKDGRTYDITGAINIQSGEGMQVSSIDGSPLNAVVHPIKLHLRSGQIQVDKITFELMRPHVQTPKSLTQAMEGGEWQLVWSDEFDQPELDESKWTYDVGNWGWGNNELQYYTERRPENARIEDGVLVIEARKNDMDQAWTSARLTTRGKVSFLYGKIEFKAMVPREKGNWAAGWTLGDDYIDELSWPYCGEIDILESVGYEVDNETGDGIAHATVHTPAYYFKINNQISSTTPVANIAGTYHTYSVEWTPTEVRAYVDGEQYYVYDKNANDLEWPFNKPQNLILNLAMGGGWGGAKGMDETVTSQMFLVDYVRVYEQK